MRHKSLLDFKIQRHHGIPMRRSDQVIILKNKEKKKRTYRLANFAIPTDRRVKIKESEKKRKEK